MMDKYVSLYFEAAYLYYLHPEHGQLMPDAAWDFLGRDLESKGLIEKSGSLFHMREDDYPEHIRKKYVSSK